MWITLVCVCVFGEFSSLHGYMISSLYPNITLEEKVPVSEGEAVAGFRSGIPCDLSPPMADDSATLVIWYKNDLKKPIYTYDLRELEADRAHHWSDVAVLGGRALFRSETSPAQLMLNPAKASDAALYRCRVDFRRSPTRNAKINLTVILPPEKITLVNDKGEPVDEKYLGPFTEGTAVNVTCVSSGGRPLPSVTWWRENELVDDSYEVLSEKRVRNTLSLSGLGRRSLHETYTCQSTNNRLIYPLAANFSVRMHLKPLWVRILGENRPFSAEQTYELSCEAVGARPPPRITWWIGSAQLKTARQSTSRDDNTTVSSLSFKPSMEDSGKFVTCRVGDTPHIVEDGWKLNIHHIPVVTLEAGNSLNLSAVVEGTNVIFECNIKSNPWVYKVAWRHKGKVLQNNAGAGMFLVNNQSLFLQSVSRERAGHYTCVASNQEGDGESNPIYLDVKYAPECVSPRAQTYGVTRLEMARVVCDVDANPGDVTFSWRTNATSGGTWVELPEGMVTSERTRSVAGFTPRSPREFGALQCAADNDVGAMRAPCLFTLVPDGKPDPLANCSVSNQTFDSLQIECDAGWDGGHAQTFEAEVRETDTHQLVRNVTSREPSFRVGGLDEGVGFDLLLYAVNTRGRSEPAALHAYAVKTAERHMGNTAGAGGGEGGGSRILPVLDTLTPLFGAILGLVVTLVTVTVAVLLALRQRQRKRQQAKKHSQDSSSKQMTDSQDSLEKNPDIIPLNTDYHPAEKNSLEKTTSLFTVPIKTLVSSSREDAESTDMSSTHTKLLQEFHPPPPECGRHASLPHESSFRTSVLPVCRPVKSSPLPPADLPAAAVQLATRF